MMSGEGGISKAFFGLKRDDGISLEVGIVKEASGVLPIGVHALPGAERQTLLARGGASMLDSVCLAAVVDIRDAVDRSMRKRPLKAARRVPAHGTTVGRKAGTKGAGVSDQGGATATEAVFSAKPAAGFPCVVQAVDGRYPAAARRQPAYPGAGWATPPQDWAQLQEETDNPSTEEKT